MAGTPVVRVNVACIMFGHSWAVRVRNGRLVELCTACNTPAPVETGEDS